MNGEWEDWVGGGSYFFEPPSSYAKYRRADRRGSLVHALCKRSLIAKMKKAGYNAGSENKYTRVPKPFRGGSPARGSSREQGPHCRTRVTFRPACCTSLRSPQWLTKSATATAPLVKWLAKNVG